MAAASTRFPHDHGWLAPTSILVFLAAAGCLWTLVIGLYDPAFSAEDLQAEKWTIGIRNAVPVTLLSFLLWTWTRRPLLSLWISAIALRLLYVANSLKLDHLETPLLPTDFKVVGSNIGGGLLLHYLPTEPRDLLTVAAVALVLIGLCFEPPSTWLRGTRRRINGVIGLVLAATLLAGIKPWRMLYPRDLLQFQSWSPNHSMEHAGLIAGLLRYQWEFSGALNEPDPAVAQDLLERYRTALSAPAPPVEPLPDIVVVQSESFFDPSRLNGLDAKNSLQNFRALSARSLHGDLRVPAYGGGTIRTEFEVLSGLALRYFPHDEYPYFRLTDNPLRGLATILGEHDYQTVAVHPNDPAFWNRNTALRSLGFSEFQSVADFAGAKVDGWFVNDSELTQHIVRQLPSEGPPRFIFAISIGAHGPYDDPPISDTARRDATTIPDGLRPDIALRLRNYLYLIENADRALGELVAQIEKRQRRTLLLFYGDHLPALPKTYARLGFRDRESANAQPVPWLLFDNAKPNAAAQRIDSASFFLPGQILSAAGIHNEPYFRLTETVREKTRFEFGFVPAEDSALAPLMQLRQRNLEQGLVRSVLDGEPNGAAAMLATP